MVGLGFKPRRWSIEGYGAPYQINQLIWDSQDSKCGPQVSVLVTVLQTVPIN